MKTLQALGKTLGMVIGAIGGVFVVVIGIPVAVFLHEIRK